MKKTVRQADLLPFVSRNAVADTINHVFRQKGYNRLYIEAGSAQILIAGVEEEVWGEIIKVI